jgi:hypothetical protein
MTDDNSSEPQDFTEKQEKIVIEGASDFSFYAAYLAYDKAWVENADEKTRLELNNLLLSLKEKKVDYPSFYHQIDQFRKDLPQTSRPRFKAKKKRAWRKSEAKKTRISRHKK